LGVRAANRALSAARAATASEGIEQSGLFLKVLSSANPTLSAIFVQQKARSSSGNAAGASAAIMRAGSAMSPHLSIDRDAVKAFCRRHHIARLALFGSVLRDDFRPESDVDVLVEFEAGHVPGLRFVTIEREFSELLHGRRVDMVTPKFLNARIRDQVLRTAEQLYVAA
jgi:predicted nucleotidyltransferase